MFSALYDDDLYEVQGVSNKKACTEKPEGTKSKSSKSKKPQTRGKPKLTHEQKCCNTVLSNIHPHFLTFINTCKFHTLHAVIELMTSSDCSPSEKAYFS